MPTADDRRGHRHPLYAISVAAELTGSGIQSLRLYERIGLVEPARTSGGTRRYSEADIDRLRRIVDLVADGVNLAGVRRILHLEHENDRLRQQLRAARRPDGDPGEWPDPATTP
jgi:MerR family transcriptional regulator/heat shock protein HspR